jgi:putative ABC transport system permease protein
MGLSWLDVQLGGRMLVRYRGLTLAGGLALALAIGLGAGWYDLMREQLHPTLPLPDGHRLVNLEVRNAASNEREPRLLHDVAEWRQAVRTIEDLAASYTVERNLILDGASPEPVPVAVMTASAFRVARVPPLLGRPLLDADERPGADPVIVLGYRVWQQHFASRADVIGQTLHLGRDRLTVVGVMPEGFAFPENHKLWIALHWPASASAPLEGPAVSVFGRLAPGVQPTQAAAEVAALMSRAAAAAPGTHEHLRPRVFPYGAEDLGVGSWIDVALTHGPVLLVLLVACANVGTLVYARTATREAEIAIRHALGASRARIVGQLFVEALVLAAAAAAVGLLAADLVLRWVFAYLDREDGLPFWVSPGLELTTVVYAVLLAIVAAGLLGALPAIKATGTVARLEAVGRGGATLRFGTVWTAAMIAQVALTVIGLVPATEIAGEAIRDHIVRSRFPAARYLAVEIALDRDVRRSEGDRPVPAERVERSFAELARRIAQEPGVLAITSGDRLPGMKAVVRRALVEVSPGAEPVHVPNLWIAAVGSGYFETFDRAILSGRDFHAGDRSPDARTAIVNEAFARQYGQGGSPVGRRVRYVESGRGEPGPWLDIVGVVRDIGMTPTDTGEAPYVYRAASPATTAPLVMGVRLAGDPAALAARVRGVAAAVDPGMRLVTVRSLDDVVWSEDAADLAASAGIAAIVSLGLFLSAAGIFSLMSVSVARRTREIGLRTALGASRGRVLADIFSRAVGLVGAGIVAGNGVVVLLAIAVEAVDVGWLVRELLITSAVMLTVGLLGCVDPARRALRIDPAEALKDA